MGYLTWAPETQVLCFTTRSDEEPLITLDLSVDGLAQPYRALLDSGASNNFIRRGALEQSGVRFVERDTSPVWTTVRLATGATVKVKKRVVGLHYAFRTRQLNDEFIVLDLDDKFDVILGMPWLKKYEPRVCWTDKSIVMKSPSTRSTCEARVCDTREAFCGDGSDTFASACDTQAPTARSCAVRDQASSRDDVSPPSSRRVRFDLPDAEKEGSLPAIKSHGIDVLHPSKSDGQRTIGNFPRAANQLQRDAVLHPSESDGRRTKPACIGQQDQGANVATILSQRPHVLHSCDPSGQRTTTVCIGPQSVPVPSVGTDVQEDAETSTVSMSKVVDCSSKSRRRTKKQRVQHALREEVTETLNVLVNDGTKVGASTLELASPPSDIQQITALPTLEPKRFLRELRKGKIAQICLLVANEDRVTDIRSAMVFPADESIRSSSSMDETVLDEKTRVERYESQSWESLKTNPLYEDLVEFKDVFPDSVPSELPKDKGVQHEIVLKPGTKYCVTRQWPLPRDQVKAIDEFFETRRKAGHVRESTSPHSSPTFCVRKATGGWRIVHAFNKLNAATVPAQTPIPRKDVIIDGMIHSTIFSCLDLMDGFYQILMRESDIPFTAVSTPSGMLWEWLVMPQGLSNAPATFNRCVTHLLRPVRAFAPSYFDDVFVHSRAEDGKSDIDVHRSHVRAVLTLMREHKLYASLKKCIFAANEIPVLGCIVGKNGVRPDPEKIRAIKEWPAPRDVKELRKFLGLAAYLHKYSRNYAEFTVPLSALLKKDAVWRWTAECQQAFEAIKQSLIEAPILAIADQDRPFHVVCDASDFAIGSALMQKDDAGAERIICYQSRQLKPAERNYPVHDKELLAMKYALAKFRVYLLGDRPFTVYTDHASLRTAVNSPHLSQRMARWLSFFAEYNFSVEYKPGRQNVVADALSRRPDYEPSKVFHSANTVVTTIPSSSYLMTSRLVTHSIRAWLSSLRISPIPPRRVSVDCQLRIGQVCTDTLYAMVFSTIALPAMIRIVSSFPQMRICVSASCMNTMMRQ